MEQDTIKKAMEVVMGTGWGGAAALVVIWPLIGWLGIQVLQAQWMLAVLGRGIVISRTTGVGAAAMPKAGIFRLLFQPLIYLGVYAIAVSMAFLDGVLSKSDKQTTDLAQNLITALKRAGANDSLLYLQHKTLEPDQAQAVKVMQDTMVAGASTLNAAQAAIMATQ